VTFKLLSEVPLLSDYQTLATKLPVVFVYCYQYLTVGTHETLLHLYEKAFGCSIRQNVLPSSRSSSEPAEVMTVEPELKSEPEDNEEKKDSYTLSQRTRQEAEEECKAGAQYEECNQV
jgi:hypothetical protein